MLSQVRGALKGAVAWIFVILLVAAFSLFGIPQVNQLFTSSAVTVGGESFSQRAVRTEYDRTYQRAVRDSGGDLTREEAIASGMPAQVVERLVSQSALLLTAIIPYLILRYFFGEMELLGELLDEGAVGYRFTGIGVAQEYADASVEVLVAHFERSEPEIQIQRGLDSGRR